MLEIGTKKIIIAIVVLIVVLLGALQLSKILDNVDMGYYKIKQSWPAGNITVESDPGVFGQWWGDLHPYQVSDIYYFSNLT